MKKILFVIGSLGGGGAEKILVDTINEMSLNDCQITLCSLFDEGVHKRELNKSIDYHAIVKIKNPILKKIISYIVLYVIPTKILYKKFIQKIGIFDYEVAFLEGLPTKILSNSQSNAIKYAWVHINFQNNFDSLRYFKDIEEYANCYKKYNKIICVSRVAKDGFIKKFGSEYPVQVVYNPLNEKLIFEKSMEEVNVYPDSEKIKIVTVGRLVQQKGYDRLLKAILKVKEINKNFILYILGEGDQKEKLEQFIYENDLKEYVHLLGYICNPYPYIKEADFFICSSREEGFSTVVTESLILGTPVVTTECSGMRELFGDYNCGIIVPNNIKGIEDGILNILKNEDKIYYYKEQAIKRGKYFKFQERLNDYRKLFK